jgi:hypothetical protein
MASLKQTIAALIECLTARWLWFPIFLGCSILLSYELGILFGWIGFIAPFTPYLYMVIAEVWREYKVLPKSEAWEGSKDIEQLVKEYAEAQSKRVKTR